MKKYKVTAVMADEYVVYTYIVADKVEQLSHDTLRIDGKATICLPYDIAKVVEEDFATL